MRSWGGRGAGRFHDYVMHTLHLVKRRLHCEPIRRFSDFPRRRTILVHSLGPTPNTCSNQARNWSAAALVAPK